MLESSCHALLRNLSFLYFLEAEHVNAEKYADIAVKADRYNARALVNKGNCGLAEMGGQARGSRNVTGMAGCFWRGSVGPQTRGGTRAENTTLGQRV